MVLPPPTRGAGTLIPSAPGLFAEGSEAGGVQTAKASRKQSSWFLIVAACVTPVSTEVASGEPGVSGDLWARVVPGVSGPLSSCV